MQSPISVSNFFIKKSLETGKEVTPMKLIKLVYLSHGWHLGLTGEPLLAAGVEAWKYGPVVPDVYHLFKRFGHGQVNSLGQEQTISGVRYPEVHNAEITAFLNHIWDIYSDRSGTDLSALTHQAGSPWDIIWHQRGGNLEKGVIIPNDLIKDYYTRKLNANKSAQPVN
jgi:uncharacterized phage-associated protein